MKKLVTNFCLVSFVLTATILLNSSCEYRTPEPAWKRDTLLPPITTVGANTFGCKLNGAFWYPAPYKSFVASYSRGQVTIRFDKSGNNNWGGIIFSSYPNLILKEGKYQYSYFFRGNYAEPGKSYSTNDTSKIGYFEILRLDSINRIISGTFEFTPENSGLNPNKVYITQGRFDLKY